MKRIRTIDRFLLFIFWATPGPFYIIFSLYLILYFEKNTIFQSWIQNTIILILPPLISFLIARIYMWLFLGMAKILRDKILASEVFEKIIWDNLDGYSFNLNDSINISCNYNECRMLVGCFGKDYKFYLFFRSSVNKIIVYAKRKRFAYRN